MEKEFRQSFYKDSMANYLILKCPSGALEGYQYRMLAANRIEGLLPCSLRGIDGESYLYYEITSRQSLARLYDHRRISGTELKKILYSIAEMFQSLAEYLLDHSCLFMDPEYIFYDFESDRYCFTYYPEKTDDQGIRKLMEYLADKIQTEGTDSTSVIYHLCDLSANPDFILRSELLDHEYEMVHLQSDDRQRTETNGLTGELPEERNPDRRISYERGNGNPDARGQGNPQDRNGSNLMGGHENAEDGNLIRERDNRHICRKKRAKEQRNAGIRKNKDRTPVKILLLAAGSLGAAIGIAVVTFTVSLPTEWLAGLRMAVFAGLAVAVVTAIYGMTFVYRKNQAERENLRRQEEWERQNAMVPSAEFTEQPELKE